jgi:hypothetical protein
MAVYFRGSNFNSIPLPKVTVKFSLLEEKSFHLVYEPVLKKERKILSYS